MQYSLTAITNGMLWELGAHRMLMIQGMGRSALGVDGKGARWWRNGEKTRVRKRWQIKNGKEVILVASLPPISFPSLDPTTYVDLDLYPQSNWNWAVEVAQYPLTPRTLVRPETLPWDVVYSL